MTTAALKVYPVYSPHFWRAYFIQMRPYLLFVSGIAGLAGIAMAAGADLPGWKIILAFIPVFLGYGFGQALTDCFQTDTDKLSSPTWKLTRKQKNKTVRRAKTSPSIMVFCQPQTTGKVL